MKMDEVIADAANASPIYEQRLAERRAGTFKPKKSATPTVSPPVMKTDVTMPPPPPAAAPVKPKPTVFASFTPSRSTMIKSNVAAGMPASGVAPKASPVLPDSDLLSNDDMSGKGYTLIGSKSGVKKWRKGNIDSGAKAQQNAMIVKSPMFRGRAAEMKADQLQTGMRMVGGKPVIVQTGGKSTPEFDRLREAQYRNSHDAASPADRKMINESLGGDVLGRQQSQIDQQRADERAGKYQAGRKVRA